ncbi:MAG: tetratricopeptide repeat protein, partial [Anaerolineae bacterium]
MRKSYLIVAVGLLVALAGCQTDAGGVEDLMSSARSFLEAGEYEKAISDLEAAVAQASDDADTHFLLGQAYTRNGQLSEAADEFRRVLELDPESA